MQAAPLRDDETASLGSLHALDVLDSAPEAEFDALVRAAALACQVPISLISLIDAGRQWFKANLGLPGVRETSRDLAFCAHAVLGDELFEVPDARLDARFAGNPLVTGAPHIRFYAGMPLRLADGSRIGTLCVIDRAPRQLDATQRELLRCLARAAALALAARREQQQRARADLILQHSADAIVGLAADGTVQRWNPAAARLFGHAASEVLGRPFAALMLSDRAGCLVPAADGPAEDRCWLDRHGRPIWVAVTTVVERDADGSVTGATKFVRDVSARVQATRDLQASEARFRAFADCSPFGIFCTDAEGDCTYSNPRWQEIHGLSLAEGLGRGWASSMHPDDAATVVAAWQASVAERRDYDLVHRVRHRDGAVRVVHARARAVLDAAGGIAGYVGSVEDISRRHQAEQALLEERQRLANIVEGMHAGTWERDLDSGDCRINAIYAAMLGHDASAAGMAAALAAPIHPRDRERADALLQAHLSGATPAYEAELRVRHRDQRWVWVLDRGKLVQSGGDGRRRLAGTRRDISERKQAAEAVRAAMQDRQRILDAMPLLVAYWDRRLLNRFANRAYGQWFGLAMETLPGLHISAVLGGELYGRLLPALTAALGGAEQHLECPIRRADGAMSQADCRFLPDLRDGRVHGLLAVVIDVTELKDAQRELEKLNLALRARSEQAEQACHAKSAFLANVSHEIRTPMNAVLGMLALLRRTELNPRQADYAAKSEGAARSLLGLLDEILDFSKIEAGKMTLDPQPFRIDRLLRDLADLVAAMLGGRPLDLRFDIDPALPALLLGDALRLRQVLTNLCGNAVKFTAAGAVVLSVSVLARDAAGVTLELAVRDTGIGIAPEHQTRIFSGFAQAEVSTTRRYGGTGLGLAISQRLVAAMGGELELDSAPGVGSRFHFRLTLPVLAEEGDPVVDAVAPRPAPVRLGGLRLLVVEDNLNNRQIALELLEGEGATVTLAGDGQQALDALAADAGYDAVLMDLQMPVLDGFDATRAIRQRLGLATLPIVAMTANAMPSDRDACLAAGMNAHVGKPFDLDALVQLLRRQCGRAAPGDAADAAAPAGTGAAPPMAAVASVEALTSIAAAAPPDAALQAAAQAAGVALAPALARLGGRRDAHARLLAGFVETLEALPTRLRQVAATGGAPAAARELHALKGLAATVGAEALAGAAADAERALHRAPAAGVAATLDDAIGIVVAALPALHALDRALGAAARPAPPAASLPPARLHAMLQALSAQLAGADMAATDSAAALRQAYGAACPAALPALDAAIGRLDFAAALGHCRALLAAAPAGD
ncbi:PAS domain S-box protein [Derxia lacustris]|uniref:PAS domain S-box protein n=1 Tax=Derxia lacustris TaxID=764842 RepID=UPI001594B33F|nr:PAS domain S-box protein [Derxia lacustris]